MFWKSWVIVLIKRGRKGMLDKFKALREYSKAMAIYALVLLAIGGIASLCERFFILSFIINIICTVVLILAVWGVLEWALLIFKKIIKMIMKKFDHNDRL